MTTTKTKTAPKLRGRKPILTRELIKELGKLLERDHTVRLACHKVGISEASFHHWTDKGREADKGIYREFLEVTTKARAKWEAALVAKIARNKEWRAAAWILERTAPKQWGNRGITVDVGAPIPTAAPVTTAATDDHLSAGFQVHINIQGALPQEPEADDAQA